MYSYEEVIGRIERARRFGKLPGVDATAKALKELGDPQEGMRFVHVAGTTARVQPARFWSGSCVAPGKRPDSLPHRI